MKRFELTQEQCHTISMEKLFDNFAVAMGYDDVSRSDTTALAFWYPRQSRMNSSKPRRKPAHPIM